MRKLFMAPAALAVLAASLLAAGQASAAVTVSFVEPERFTDVPTDQAERERVLRDLERHVATLGAKLPADRNLKLEILDLDMAGRIEQRRRTPRDVRIVRDRADWPRMSVRYSLESGGAVLARGEETVSDINYHGSLAEYRHTDALQYEKKMIDDWFARTFLAR